ncbi:hypothetical protein CFM96_02795 [Klebsiella michiganensis]|nr:hypothetical protein [Klebsiella michiganensis]
MRNKRKNRHRPVPVDFSSPYCPQNAAIRYESADDPRFDANAADDRKAQGIDTYVLKMVVLCNHLPTRLTDHDLIPAY